MNIIWKPICKYSVPKLTGGYRVWSSQLQVYSSNFFWNMYIKGTIQQYPEHAVIYFFTIALLWWPILNTRYIVTEQHLVIRSMLFKWQINRSDITKVSESHNFISSPALSLDRLRIDYQKNGVISHILISPKDKDVFCQALRQGRDKA